MDTNRYILLQPNSKIPTGNHWQYVDKDGASDHLAAGGNIALATGERSGLFVLDVDVKNGAGGQEPLDRVQEVYGLLPPTRKNGRATWRARGWQYGEISGGGG